MSQALKSIVFDLGGVLLDWNPRYLFREFFQNPDALERFLIEIDFDTWNAELDKGADRMETTQGVIKNFPQYEIPMRAFQTRWLETLNGEISGTVEILNQLLALKTYPLFAITNYEKDCFEWSKEKFPFLKTFKSVVVSAEEKIAKPDPRIFKLAIDRFQIEPQSSLFIDDRIENVESAERMGFQIHHFKNPPLLKEHLKKLSVLS